MISFIILHYKSIDETLECLKCLTNTFNKKDISLIVVDNASLNKSQEQMIKEYTEDIILLDENMGFAKANNIGCNYAIKKYKPEFLAVINNDVFITQKDFIDIIKEDYQKYQFDMLGPYIDSPSKESVNPFPVLGDIDAINKYIDRTNKLINIYSSRIKYFIFNSLMKIKHLINKPVIPTNGKEIKKKVGLHGCAIVFSKQYYKKYQDIFYNDTFLFHEEEFLYQRVLKDNLVSLYDPKLKVFHKEGSSMKKKGNTRLSKLFKEQEKLKSLNMLVKEKKS